MEPLGIAGIAAGAGAVIRHISQSKKDQHELVMSVIKKQNDIANDANNRGSAFGRRFAMVIVLSVGFLGLLYAAMADIQVSQIIERKPFLDLLGIVKLGGGPQVITAEGFVIPPYVTDSIIAIIFFLFGNGAMKR